MRPKKNSRAVFGAWSPRDQVGASWLHLLEGGFETVLLEEAGNQHGHLFFSSGRYLGVALGIHRRDLDESLQEFDDRVHKEDLRETNTNVEVFRLGNQGWPW
jgi:hypothetical protein